MRDEPRPEKMLTFRSGGWVLLVTVLVCTLIFGWAIYPALKREQNPLPGDGRNPETYGFDLGTFSLDRGQLAVALRRRDMVPVLHDPGVQTVAEVTALSTGRDKYVVPDDRVVGVVINGEARAYPLLLLNVHEIVHDTLGGVPIAVTYSWVCDAPAVWDRRGDAINADALAGADADATTKSASRILQWRHSGLVYCANSLYFDPQPSMQDESLWLQMTGEAISGPRKGETLREYPYQLVSWRTWRDLHPETTVAARHPEYLKKRYEGARPSGYFESDAIDYPFAPKPPENGIRAKERVVVLNPGSDAALAVPHSWIREHADERGRVEIETDAGIYVLTFDLASHSVLVQRADMNADNGNNNSNDDDDEPSEQVHVRHALWFAWHALHPNDPLFE